RLPARLVETFAPGRNLRLDHGLVGDDAHLEGLCGLVLDARSPGSVELRPHEIEQIARASDLEHRYRRVAGQRRDLLDQTSDRLYAVRLGEKRQQDARDGPRDVDLDLARSRLEAAHDPDRLLVGPLRPFLAEPDRAADALLCKPGLALGDSRCMTAPVGVVEK